MNANRQFWTTPTGLAVVFTVVVAAVAANQGFIEVSLRRLAGEEIGVLFLTLVFTALVIERAVEVFVNNRYDPEEARIQRGIREEQQKVTLLEQALEREIARGVPGGPDPDAAVKERDKRIRNLRAEIDKAIEKVRAAKVDALDEQIELERRKATAAGASATVLGTIAAGAGVRILGQFLPTDESTGRITGPLGHGCSDPEIAQRFRELGEGPARQALLDACESVDFQLGVFRFADILLTALLLAGGADGIHQLVKTFLSKRNALRPTA